MGKKQTTAIDSLFGSKTRVKLLHLFFNNSGKSFYVREMTRVIDEQINSVRRELANLLEVGVIISSSAENKLYYEVNQRYEHYNAFRSIFSDKAVVRSSGSSKKLTRDDESWKQALADIKSVRIVVIAGSLVEGSASKLDVVVAGPKSQKIEAIIKEAETNEGRELKYSIMSYDEFYYRLSVHDRFVTQILSARHEVIVDRDNVLNGTK